MGADLMGGRPPLIFPVLLQCKREEAAHSLPLLQGCMVEAV